MFNLLAPGFGLLVGGPLYEHKWLKPWKSWSWPPAIAPTLWTVLDRKFGTLRQSLQNWTQIGYNIITLCGNRWRTGRYRSPTITFSLGSGQLYPAYWKCFQVFTWPKSGCPAVSTKERLHPLWSDHSSWTRVLNWSISGRCRPLPSIGIILQG